jgi:photosystem II stability/assembly factor-like uncharacterized protein
MRPRHVRVSIFGRLARLRRACRAACWLVALSAAGAAEAIVWTSNGPTGGLVQALAVDPTDPAKLFAATSSGGFFRSSNGGFSWSAVNTGIAPSGFAMTGIAVNPMNPARVYASGQSGAQGFAFRSADGGETWSSVHLDASANAVATGTDPFRPDTVYYASQVLYRSINGGDNWYGVSFTGPYYCVVVDPTLWTTVYAGAVGHIRKSTDYGGTWVTKSNGLPAGRDVRAIAIHPTTGSILYAGVEASGVYKSTDAGENWTPVGPAGFSVNGLVIDPANPNTIHAAGSMLGGVGVYKSTNAGASWTAQPLAQSAWALVHAPSSPARLFAGTSDGVWASSDAAASWSAANTGFANTAIRSLASGASNRAYAGSTNGKVFRSSNGGASWATGVEVAPEQIYAVAVDPSNSDVVYAGTLGTHGIHKSVNGGATWSHLNTGTPAPINGYALAVDPTNPSIVYAGAFGGVFRSTQGGANWSITVAGTPAFPVSLAIDPASPSTLYAGSDPIDAPFSGVYKTTNSGTSWSPVNTGLPSVAGTAVQALAIDPATGAVYAGLENLGVYKTTNGAASWSAANTGLTNLDVTSLRVDPAMSSTVYAGTRGGGVFRSSDGGTQWVAIDEGIHNPRIEALAVTAPGRPLAGSAGNGVFFVPACADEQDNDGDGFVDFDGGPALGTPDPQCTTPTRNRESPGSCGLGGEVALGSWLLLALRRAGGR